MVDIRLGKGFFSQVFFFLVNIKFAIFVCSGGNGQGHGTRACISPDIYGPTDNDPQRRSWQYCRGR